MWFSFSKVTEVHLELGEDQGEGSSCTLDEKEQEQGSSGMLDVEEQEQGSSGMLDVEEQEQGSPASPYGHHKKLTSFI